MTHPSAATTWTGGSDGVVGLSRNSQLPMLWHSLLRLHRWRQRRTAKAGLAVSHSADIIDAQISLVGHSWHRLSVVPEPPNNRSSGRAVNKVSGLSPGAT